MLDWGTESRDAHAVAKNAAHGGFTKRSYSAHMLCAFNWFDLVMTPDDTYAFEHVSLEHRVLLNSASSLLQKEFAGQFNTPTIERFLISSYDEFAGRATVTAYLPVFAERFARQRLRAMAIVEGVGEHNVPIVLFLCVHNAGRSQMAMGYFKELAGDRAMAWSGGSEPGGSVNPAAIDAMAEVGIDISEEFPKPWTDEIVRAADVVITMGCGDACPIFPGKRYEDWVLEDPAGLGVDDIRPIRGEIEARVRNLLNELNVEITQ